METTKPVPALLLIFPLVGVTSALGGEEKVAGAPLRGRDRWVAELCQAAGFRGRFGSAADGLSHALSLVASQGPVCIVPASKRGQPASGVRMVPLPNLPYSGIYW